MDTPSLPSVHIIPFLKRFLHQSLKIEVGPGTPSRPCIRNGRKSVSSTRKYEGPILSPGRHLLYPTPPHNIGGSVESHPTKATRSSFRGLFYLPSLVPEQFPQDRPRLCLKRCVWVYKRYMQSHHGFSNVRNDNENYLFFELLKTWLDYIFFPLSTVNNS